MLANLKTDEYPNPLPFLKRIVVRRCKSVLTSLTLALKLNTAHYIQGRITGERSVKQLKEVVK